MKKTDRKKKWKISILSLWIIFLVAGSFGCYCLQRANTYKRAETELMDQAEIISRQFASLVYTNYCTRAVLYDRLISEVKALSFALENYDDIEEAKDFLEDIVNTTEMKNLWIYDRSGNIVFGSSDAPENPIEPGDIPALLDSREYESEESIYSADNMYQITTYLLQDDNNSLLWGVNDQWLIYVKDILSDSLKNVIGFFDWDQVLQDISIGWNGAVLAVSKSDGSVLSYADPAAKGKPVEDLNIKTAGSNDALSADQLLEAFSQTGEVKAIKVDSALYYATRINNEDDLFLVMFPAETIEKDVIRETAILMLLVALITGIGVLNAFCLAADHSKQSKNNDDKKRRPLVPAGNLKVAGILAVFLVLVFSLYMETHLVYSRMFEYTSTTAEDVMQKKNDSDRRLEEIEEWSEKGNLEKSRIARCIIRHADQGKVDRQYVSDLADRLNVISLYVFDSQGKVSVTNAPYDGIVINEDSPFHALLEGTESVSLKPELEDESGMAHQEAGVTMIDDSNRVAGAIVIADDIPFYSSIADDLSFESVFQRVFLKDNTVVMAVDSENMTIRYFGQVDGSFLVSDRLSYDYTETDIAALGLDESKIRDYFNGELFAIDNQYFASIRRNDNAFLMVLRPLVFIDSGNLLSVIYVTAATLLFFILIICVTGRFKLVPAEDSVTDEHQTTDNQDLNRSATDTDKDEDDVFTVLGSLANANKPYFEERWPSDGKKWRDKTPLERFSSAVKLICIVTFALIVLHVVIAGKSSVLYYSFTGDWSSGINLYSVTSCLIAVVVLVLLKEIIHKVLYLIARAVHSKGETICHLLNSFTGYVLFIAGIFIILRTIGVNLAAMSLTAGVAGVIFGIGCQNIVSDILAGIIMAFEGVASVGDFVSYNGKFGVIHSIGVRTTKLKWFSEITIVRNNEFKNYINMPADDIDRVTVDLCIDLKESLIRVEGIIDKELPRIQENLSAEMGEKINCPHYRGVQSIEDSGIKLSFALYCKGMHYGWARRLLSRELLLMCERNEIRLAMPQIVINEPADVQKG